MPIWAVASITEEPEVLLSDWQVVEIPGGTRHFVGYNQSLREGRVSSMIVEFDPATRTGINNQNNAGRVIPVSVARPFSEPSVLASDPSPEIQLPSCGF